MIKHAVFAAVVLLVPSAGHPHENPQTRQIQHKHQARCIVVGSEVHQVYAVMLAYLEKDVAEWNKLKKWVNRKMPLIASTIDVHRAPVLENFSDLRDVPLCKNAGY